MKVKSDTKRFFTILFLVWIVYVALSLLAPAAESVSRYGLTLTQANLLRITIVLPLFFIWVTGLYSVINFRRYTKLVNNSSEEEGFRKITRGLWMLLLVIILPSFVTAVANYFPDSAGVQQAGIIVRNYVSAGLYLVGFIYLWQASKSLLTTVNGEDWGRKYRSWVLAGVGALTFIYVWFIFQNPFRSVSNDPLVRPTYHLPDVLIILTIVVPYFLIWLFGSMAILNFWSFTKQVPGIIYRQTFYYVANGLSVTVALLIALQFLSQANASLSRAALGIVLVIIYLLLLAIAVGYWLVARGAKKLAAIEEIN